MFRSNRRAPGQRELERTAEILALAQQTAETAIADARKEAEQIIAHARQEAEQIIADAHRRAQHT